MILLAESREGLEGKILGSEEHYGISADRDIVFIDRGRKDGIEVGQSYNIFYEVIGYVGPKDEGEMHVPPLNFARILTLRTEETTSTAIVTYALRTIRRGDRIGTGLTPEEIMRKARAIR